MESEVAKLKEAKKKPRPDYQVPGETKVPMTKLKLKPLKLGEVKIGT